MDSSRVAVVVEDDQDIREAVRHVLLASGFTVHPAATGTEGVAAVRLHDPAVVTLDLTLPDIDGFEVARQVRQFSDTYIIMVTARTEELDTLMGLESGADDYITKPFRPRELRARVEALLRRSRDRNPAGTGAPDGTGALDGAPWGAAPPAGAGPGHETAGTDPAGPGGQHAAGVSAAVVDRPAVFEHNGLCLDPATRTVRREGAELELTRTEFDLLLALMRAGRVVRPKRELARGIRSSEYDTGAFVSEAEERAIEVHIGNLRRKLGDDPRLPRWVETVRGVGYRLAPTSVHAQGTGASR
ncbi:response regulator transcription factor [Arthrobacter globiformis]|uniref:DNA-binding response regulator n=1 Tax=Arthrobacter globiformis TaxID=1665 RepID=A0A328HFH4_ARTGO|nr:response regulator transcription factor [Arthrobacter globiformis]RAM37307.1 DNA-binding response regulator [Arthrobacter globiformis]